MSLFCWWRQLVWDLPVFILTLKLFHLIFLPLSHWEAGVRKCLGGWLAASQSQPTSFQWNHRKNCVDLYSSSIVTFFKMKILVCTKLASTVQFWMLPQINMFTWQEKGARKSHYQYQSLAKHLRNCCHIYRLRFQYVLH